MKFVIGKAGFVVNIVSAPPPGPDGKTPAPSLEENQLAWLVDDAFVVNVGDVFDLKDIQIDAIDIATFRTLFRHENMIRELIRAVRTNNGISTAATTEGLPLSANAPDLTLAQARTAFKSLIP